MWTVSGKMEWQDEGKFREILVAFCREWNVSEGEERGISEWFWVNIVEQDRAGYCLTYYLCG